MKTDDSPLGNLFQKKILEVKRKIDLLENRGEGRFTEAAFKLFGKPSSEILTLCNTVLQNLPLQEKQPVAHINDEQLKAYFLEVLKTYGLKHWRVEIQTGLIANCTIDKKNKIKIRKGAKFSEQHYKNLIIHEIETHALTAENGKYQPYRFFNHGGPDYLETQEGLALYNVKKYGQESPGKDFYIACLVKATELAFEKSFSEVFQSLLEAGLPSKKAWKATLRVKRGFLDTSQKGAFTKDYLYFKGQYSIEKFIQNGGNIKDLYLGKFHVRDLELIKQIPDVKEPKILPKWLENK